MTIKERNSVILSSKAIAFMISMGALGNVLAAITIAPTMVKQVALDFSALPVLITSVFGGAILGGVNRHHCRHPSINLFRFYRRQPRLPRLLNLRGESHTRGCGRAAH